MKLIKKEYTPISGCTNFWAWVWFTADWPYGSFGDENWFRHCGSPDRLLICRRFGFTREYRHNREEISFIHLLLILFLILEISFLGIEIFLIILF